MFIFSSTCWSTSKGEFYTHQASARAPRKQNLGLPLSDISQQVLVSSNILTRVNHLLQEPALRTAVPPGLTGDIFKDTELVEAKVFSVLLSPFFLLSAFQRENNFLFVLSRWKIFVGGLILERTKKKNWDWHSWQRFEKNRKHNWNKIRALMRWQSMWVRAQYVLEEDQVEEGGGQEEVQLGGEHEGPRSTGEWPINQSHTQLNLDSGRRQLAQSSVISARKSFQRMLTKVFLSITSKLLTWSKRRR